MIVQTRLVEKTKFVQNVYFNWSLLIKTAVHGMLVHFPLW